MIQITRNYCPQDDCQSFNLSRASNDPDTVTMCCDHCGREWEPDELGTDTHEEDEEDVVQWARNCPEAPRLDDTFATYDPGRDVLVHVRGGLVQWVATPPNGPRVVIIDFDVTGGEDYNWSGGDPFSAYEESPVDEVEVGLVFDINDDPRSDTETREEGFKS